MIRFWEADTFFPRCGVSFKSGLVEVSVLALLRLTCCLPVMIAALLGASGCLNPARQQVPAVPNSNLEDRWRTELVPGRKADRALAYLLTEGFECQMTRDENKNVEQIVATLPKGIRDASGRNRNWRITLVFAKDVIQTAEVLPLNSRSVR